MASRLNPYLGFRGNAREAMEFYRSVFDGELVLNTFADNHASHGPADDDLVMHGMLETPSGFTLMGSDTPEWMPYHPGDNYSVSLSGDDEAELRGYWDKLSDGATITVPLQVALWGDAFGMCTDRFGVIWVVNISGAAPA